MKMLQKERVSDSQKFLSNYQYQHSYSEYIFLQGNLELFDKQWKLNAVRNDIKNITNILQQIVQHNFNKINYSANVSKENIDILIKKVSNQENIINFFRFLIKLTSLDDRFIQSGSNSLHLLVEMKVDLRGQSFINIRIRNTSLYGANLVRCDLSLSEFDNVIISGMNLNGAKLFNCKWRNLGLHEGIELNGHEGEINQVCFSSDGKSLASCSDDTTIRLWDVKTGKIRTVLKGESEVSSVCFSFNGTILASRCGKYVYLWNLKTEKYIWKLNGHSSTKFQVCFSPDSTILAFDNGNNSICLWDVKTGQQKAKLDGHSNTCQVCFSPNGTTLASGNDDNSIYLWDVKTGQQKAKLDGHSSQVYSVCFSPDGTILASGSNDQSIRLWDVKTGQEKAKLDGHSFQVKSICFSPDGSTLASGSYGDSIRLWDIQTGKKKPNFLINS
ncbi:unnamed protein product (macronuclear) [Paramecium tetraurelia]|uniref:Uncharacterized protein n=1 Tax=Paramecium tetraurelia TaxID=5888 RepID=A0DA37_PARTE|nr:uncharacterized protein GSPATT00039354001 [Paramecium tetraurelia]CAK79904.1 unnamed protein product [Paramecium tetraurelia]|eukprot:XP_001447301.1 hypothetical protein (macronuclear) [Paramecium tetraurelia strain d4-2]